MTPADLHPFPTIEQVYRNETPAPTLAGLPIETLLDAATYQINDVEGALAILATGRGLPALVEQTSKLFVKAWRDWDCARTELLALSTIERDHTLESLGWPPGYGDNAPFDGVLRDAAGRRRSHCTFDVKSAQGTGLLLVHEKLEAIAKAWASSKGLGIFNSS